MIVPSRKFKIRNLGMVVLLSLLITFSLDGLAENLTKVIDLEGRWKFSIGDNLAWAERDFNDMDWDDVSVPNSWETNGFNNYDGFAWYRKEFTLQTGMEKGSLLLILGYIDDVDEVYLNGKLIAGMGIMPPEVVTAHTIIRKYPLPEELLISGGKNVIAVRVYDEYRQGGIYAGPVGIFRDKDNDLLVLNLAGYWNFNPQFNIENTNNQFYKHEQGNIYVPGFWENFGYADFDGTATYSIRFSVPQNIRDEKLMVVLGYIDDIDKVYLNNQRIGTVEDLKQGDNLNKNHIYILRGYNIPPDLLKKTGTNFMEVKVYDTEGIGGIYEGPVGLIYADDFALLHRKKENIIENFWENFFNELFGW